MKAIDIAFTVLPVTDLKVAREFYERTLGLSASSVLEKDGMGMIEYEIGSSTLAIGAGAPFFKPAAEGGAVAIEVEDFDVAVATLKAANTPFVLEAYETPVCHMAIVKDPDGNFLMLHKRKAREVCAHPGRPESCH